MGGGSAICRLVAPDGDGSAISRFLFLVQILAAPDGGGSDIYRFSFLVQNSPPPDGGGTQTSHKTALWVPSAI
jgi:hypothetical protein